MILPDFDQGGFGQPAFCCSFNRVTEGHHVVGPGVKNLGPRLHRLGLPPFLPRRAEQDEPRRSRSQVHRHSPTPARTHHDLGLVLVEGYLGRLECQLEVVVVQGRLMNIVAVRSQVGRLHTPDTRVPAVEVEDSHW
jgi:hypothetical protein